MGVFVWVAVEDGVLVIVGVPVLVKVRLEVGVKVMDGVLVAKTVSVGVAEDIIEVGMTV